MSNKIKKFVDNPANEYTARRASFHDDKVGRAALSRLSSERGDNWLPDYLPEESCPGHVGTEICPKICTRCGIHIDSLRPPEEESDENAL